MTRPFSNAEKIWRCVPLSGILVTVRIYKTRPFQRWARAQAIDDKALANAIRDLEQGRIDAALGAHLYKQRVARKGQGKSGSYRTIIAYRTSDSAFFLYGFDKGSQSNIAPHELSALKKLAKQLTNYSLDDLTKARDSGALLEVYDNE